MSWWVKEKSIREPHCPWASLTSYLTVFTTSQEGVCSWHTDQTLKGSAVSINSPRLGVLFLWISELGGYIESRDFNILGTT